jgi:hypothetical protein
VTSDAGWHTRLARLERQTAVRGGPLHEFQVRHAQGIRAARDEFVAWAVVADVLVKQSANLDNFRPLGRTMAFPPDATLPTDLRDEMKSRFQQGNMTERERRKWWGPCASVGLFAINIAWMVMEAAIAGDPEALGLRRRAWRQRGGTWEPSPEARRLAKVVPATMSIASLVLGFEYYGAQLHDVEVVDGVVVVTSSSAHREAEWGTFASLASKLEVRGGPN